MVEAKGEQDVDDYRQMMEKAFLQCDEALNTSSGFDVQLSGSTVCSVLFDGNRLHCANAGDSRAIKVQVISPNGLLDLVKPD